MQKEAICEHGPEAPLGPVGQGSFGNGQTSPNVIFLLEITDAVSSGLKRRETFQRVISIHVLEGTMNAERYIKVLEQHMLPSR